MGQLSHIVKGNLLTFFRPGMNGRNILSRIALLFEGKSLSAFCGQAGLKYETIKKWFQRKKAPDAGALTESLVRISRTCRVDLHWLITGEHATSELNTRIGRRLKHLREKRGWTQETLGKKLGMTPQVLGCYEKGDWPISGDLLAEFAKTLSIPAAEFLQKTDTPTARTSELKIFQAASSRNVPAIRNEDYVSIPLTDSAIAAGQPIIQTDNIEDYVLLHIRAVKKRTNLVASRVDGNSMEPVLHSGDIVVIDRDDKKISKHKIYAIFFENGMTAKYLQKEKSQLILQPINPDFQVQIVDLNEHPDPIVGRIVGAWKDF